MSLSRTPTPTLPRYSLFFKTSGERVTFESAAGERICPIAFVSYRFTRPSSRRVGLSGATRQSGAHALGWMSQFGYPKEIIIADRLQSYQIIPGAQDRMIGHNKVIIGEAPTSDQQLELDLPPRRETNER